MEIEPVDPMPFLERLASSAGPAAKKLAILHLKPLLTPHLLKHGLEWPDVAPMLKTVGSIEELKAAAADPMAFLVQLAAMRYGALRRRAGVQRAYRQPHVPHRLRSPQQR